MSIVDEKYCACGKLWSEENPDCVFNYHKKQKQMRTEKQIRETLLSLQKSPFRDLDKDKIAALKWVLGEID